MFSVLVAHFLIIYLKLRKFCFKLYLYQASRIFNFNNARELVNLSPISHEFDKGQLSVSVPIAAHMSNSTKGFLHRLLHRLRPQLKSLLGVDSRDEILTQLNAADEPTPDIGTPRPCNGITLPPRRKHIGSSPPSSATYIVS